MHSSFVGAHFLRSFPFCVLTVGALVTGTHAAGAQPSEALRNIVHLASTGQVEVEQDWLQMTLTTLQQGSDAAAVQKKLQQTLDGAMRVLKPMASGQEMQLRSGSFGVYPQHNNQGKISSWQGRAELVVEGRNFSLISQAAAQANGMTISSMGFGLSKEGHQKVQEQAQALAIEGFKNRAALLAKQFGFTGYSLREVSVNTQDGSYAPRMMRANAPMPASAKIEIAEPISVEAGKTQVTVDVSGAVQLQ